MPQALCRVAKTIPVLESIKSIKMYMLTILRDNHRQYGCPQCAETLTKKFIDFLKHFEEKKFRFHCGTPTISPGKKIPHRL